MPNKKALITGGSRGIGRAIVKELVLAQKMDVAFIYNSNEAMAKELSAELSNSDSRVMHYKANVSSAEEAQASVDAAISELGGLDILVNNAGITKDNLLLRMSVKDFDDVIQTNLNSVFNFSKAVLRAMIKQRYGRIINITSVVGIIGNPGQANYVASKAGVIGFTKSAAKELASRNITVNAIAPGFIKSDMTDKLTDDQKAQISKNIPLNRLGEPEDIARVVSFLCSPAADYITGQVITVDGGMTM